MLKPFKSPFPPVPILAVFALGVTVVLLFLAAVNGFLAAQRDMKAVVSYNNAMRLSHFTNSAFQISISKAKNYAILKDGINKQRTLLYFQKAQKLFWELSDVETGPEGKALLFKMGSGLKNMEFTLGIFISTAKKTDSAEKLYRRYLKDVTIDFDNACQDYTAYLGAKIRESESDLSNRVKWEIILALVGILLSLTGMVVGFSSARRLRRALQGEQQRELYFRGMIENIQDVITVLDFNGNQLFASPTQQKVIGYSPEEMQGKGFAEFIHPEDLPAVQAVFRSIVEDPGEVNRVKYRFRHKNGEWIVVDSIGKTFRSEDQECVIVANRDITEQEKAEEALRQKELYFRSLIENSHDVISITGKDGLMTYISPSVKRILGYEPPERIGKNYGQIIHPDDVERIRGELGKLMGAKGASWTVEFRLRHKDGSWRNVESTGVNLLEDPAVGGLVYNLRDVTEKKAAEEALRQSEEKFRNLIENSNDVIMLVGTDTKTLYISPSVRKVMGYEPGERLGHSFLELTHPDDMEKARGLVKDFGYRFGATVGAEVRAKHKDGSWRTLDVVASNLLNHPVVRGVIINYRDVTEKKLAEEALRQSEENFRDLIEKSPDAIIVHTLEKTVYVNEAMLKLLGYAKAEELVGQKPEMIVHPDERRSVKARIQKLKSGGDYNPPLERKFLAKDGREVHVEVASFTIRFQGEPMIVAIARDLTERKEAERALVKFERLSTIGEMAASLAHEIRNPLASISAAAQILKRKTPKQDQDTEKYLGAILEQTERLNQLILDTLHFSRAEKPVDQESFSLKGALQGALRLSQVQFGPSHTKVHVEWEAPGEDLQLRANPQRVQQVLVNLFLNAYQAMTSGGTLTIGLKADPQWASIRISDTGPGIPEEEIGRIFEPFFTTKKSGSGLGLAICHRIAAEYGGRLEVERLKPHGTAFIFTLPLKEGRAA